MQNGSNDDKKAIRYAHFERLGFDRVKADMEQTGGMRDIGGPPELRELAWQWLREKEARRLVGSKKNDTYSIQGDVSETYRTVKNLVDNIPDLVNFYSSNGDAEVMDWLGRAYAVVSKHGDMITLADFRAAQRYIVPSVHPVDRMEHSGIIRSIMSRIMADLESQLPRDSAGAFIGKGDPWAAFVAISDVVARAKKDLFVVDPYLSDQFLLTYGGRIADGTATRFMASGSPQTKKYNDPLIAAARAWNGSNALRPTEVRLANHGQLHDRVIVVDEREVWIVTQSFKDLATNSPATVIKFFDDLTPEKIAAYEGIWANLQSVV